VAWERALRDNRAGSEEEATVADDDDDRDDREDEDEEQEAVKVAKRPVAAKPAAKKTVLDPVDEQTAILREIRDMLQVAHEKQDRYLWLLLPVIAILLIIAIFQVVKL
jgi:hypothetical protein